MQTLRSAGSAGIGSGEGVGGLKSLGVRELTYRLCFLASAVQPEASSLSGVAAVKGDADQGKQREGEGE